MYVASKNYKILCHETCYHVKNIKDHNKWVFRDLEEGLEKCERVCKTCKAKPWVKS